MSGKDECYHNDLITIHIQVPLSIFKLYLYVCIASCYKYIKKMFVYDRFLEVKLVIFSI